MFVTITRQSRDSVANVCFLEVSLVPFLRWGVTRLGAYGIEYIGIVPSKNGTSYQNELFICREHYVLSGKKKGIGGMT